MITIDKHYIDSAIKIRREYTGLVKNLESCEEELKEISKKMLTESELLDEIKENLGKYKTPEEAQEVVFAKLNDIDVHQQKLYNIYKPINDRIEELGSQERILFQNIKGAYPSLTDEQIVKQVNKYIDK